MVSAQPAEPEGGILIVDDHESTLNSLRRLLAEAFPGIVIATAASAEEALLHCRSSAPSAIVMDIGLPDMNGIDATRIIKKELPQAHVVAHSNTGESILGAPCIAAGATAFVNKSDTAVVLVPLIARLLSLPHSST